MTDPQHRAKSPLDWFTPSRRKAIYSALIPVFGILVAHGLLTAEDTAHIIEALGYLLGVGAVGIARANVNK